ARASACAKVLLGSISQPDSIWHVEEQQSPLIALPSSHCSAPTIIPSPQIPPQTLGWPAQIQPVSTWQAASHPSPGARLGSSQGSLAATTPSPHEEAHLLGSPEH